MSECGPIYKFDRLRLSSCVGVWQLDRVEIIANDRMCTDTWHAFATYSAYRGKPHHTFVCRFLVRGASHRRRCQEPGRHEPHQHRLRRQVRPFSPAHSLAATISSTNLLVTLRRLIGRRYDDPTVKKDQESWPFKVVDDNGSPKVEVEYLGERPSHGVLQYNFVQPDLLLEALLALCINRWLDINGM